MACCLSSLFLYFLALTNGDKLDTHLIFIFLSFQTQEAKKSKLLLGKNNNKNDEDEVVRLCIFNWTILSFKNLFYCFIQSKYT
jgi:hypothetical protein